MISVMNKDGEIDRKSDSIEEPEDVKGKRISEGGVDGAEDEKCSNSSSDEVKVSAMELDSGAQDAKVGSKVFETGKSDETRVKGEVRKESDDGEMELKDSDAKVEILSADELEARDEESEGEDGRKERVDDDARGEAGKGTVSQYNSLLSEFDDFVANENSGQLATSRALRYGFEVGDMVWGKVKSHPWWPGHIFNEAFATAQVRRTRREGHVLVAFFGDSSYGWFDPAELIPFDANFAEKSRQLTSRSFIKAVEEAVDEVSRRRGLALACKCRNPNNFRATNVQGYFAVDVPDYEPRAVYSAIQIRKARDNCRPSEILSFVKQLALSPSVGDEKNLSFVKNKATVFCFRRAVFEEFDETYAQAFNVQSGRSSRDPVVLPSRAPLSGPMVIAETLGGGTSATKHNKVKDSTKKDRYLFKRRDESGNAKDQQTSQEQPSSSAQSAYVEGSVAVGDGDFVLQKRASPVSSKPQISEKHEQTGSVSLPVADSSSNVGESVIVDQAPARSSLATEDVIEDEKPSLDEVKEEAKEGPRSVSDRVEITKTTASTDLSGNGTVPCMIDDTSQSYKQDYKQDGEGFAEFKREENVKISRPDEDIQQSQLSSTPGVEGSHGMDQVLDGSSVEGLPTDAKRVSGMSASVGVKKAKAKRPLEESNSENSMTEGKKKKKKKQLGSETGFRDPQKHLVSKKSSSTGKIGVKSTQIGLAAKEESKVKQSKKISASNNLSDSVGNSLLVGNIELELPELLSDLQALALDPFHGLERNSPAIVRKFFLRFRSLVYQKSLVLSPPSENESIEVRPSKSAVAVGASDNNSSEHVRDLPSSKPAKPTFRSDDPTIAGRKRAPSDRQEEIAVKRSKKISDIKSLAAEKKATPKTSEVQRGEGRESAVPLVRRNKPDSAKRFEPPAKVVEPTMLVMKFPPKTSLPSPAELKARFARFGPMDQAGLRVFWKSTTCRVVFLHKSDAQAAYKYAISNNSLFGNISVRFYVKEVGTPGPEAPELGKSQGDDIYNDAPRAAKDPAVLQRPSVPQLQPQPAVQLKSCLKKSTGDESGQLTGASGSNKGATPRVKFALAGEESTSRVVDQAAAIRNISNNSNASFADNGTPPSTIAMDFSVRNFQKVVPSPSPSSILPLPQFAKAPLNNLRHPDMMAPRNTPIAPPPPPTIDISQQMLNLLTRCNDVVTNVTSLLGYVPYHPL
ncbi:PWWP domain-containing protein 1-like [Humulus lupulus]|uniref:PWWP domain-containing protein 1-like n=1 Tax=Humulus lupulus TaxID=3486 RepID=UPI002B40C95C|nr:PWWP domain-containing protein 1-like [Humulus lupulus]